MLGQIRLVFMGSKIKQQAGIAQDPIFPVPALVENLIQTSSNRLLSHSHLNMTISP